MRKFILVAMLLAACGDDAGSDDRDASSDSVKPGDKDASSADGGKDAGKDATVARDGGGRDGATGEPPSDASSDSDSGSAAGDAGGTSTPDAATPDAGVSQGDTVPVFVAMGYGGFRTISCDNGLTWVNDQQEAANGGDDGNLVRGLAFGAGKFVAAVGGGGVRKLWVSEDGVTWNKQTFKDGNGYSDVAYGIGKFVAGGGHVSIVSSDGATWGNEGTMGTGGILRNLAFGNISGGRFVGVGDQGRRMNSTDGITWGAQVQEGPDLHGIDFGAGVFVATADAGGTRYSEDGGATWKSGSVNGASGVRGILYDGKRFIVTTAGNTFTSTDGKSWQSNNASGGPDAFAVNNDGKHYAGTRGKDYFHSTDGITWQRVRNGSGQDITRVKFGLVKPSSVCPKK